MASRFREKMVQLNHTMSQLLMSQHALDEAETNKQTPESGQDELRTVVKTVQDELERQAKEANETKQRVTDLEMELKEPTVPTESTAHEESAVYKEPEYTSCVDLMENGYNSSGVFEITIPYADPVKVSMPI